jgi:hypothetical protein
MLLFQKDPSNGLFETPIQQGLQIALSEELVEASLMNR